MKKAWTPGKIAILVLSIAAGLILLLAALAASVFQLIYFFGELKPAYSYEYEYREKIPAESDEADNSYASEDEYYDFANDVRDDLSYQITFQEYSQGAENQNGGQYELDFVYPVVSGEIVNTAGINQTIFREISDVEELLEASVDDILEGETYQCFGEGFVTYMSEDILSVVFLEYIYLDEGTDENFMESYVKSMNFDLQTGMLLGNTHILDIDDSFSVDFRERCEIQNGEIWALSYMSDQEITSYLTNNDSLIIFYTPLGMEIGFNYYDGWVTVTYRDYENFVKKF